MYNIIHTRTFLATIDCVSLRIVSLTKALLCNRVELSNVHPILKCEASGGSICTPITFWNHRISDIFLAIHC